MRYLCRATGGGPRRSSRRWPDRSGAGRARLPLRMGGQDLRNRQRMFVKGLFSVDEFRYSIEQIPPVAYVNVGYYGRWLLGSRAPPRPGRRCDRGRDRRAHARARPPAGGARAPSGGPGVRRSPARHRVRGRLAAPRGRRAAALRRRGSRHRARVGHGRAHSAAGVRPRPSPASSSTATTRSCSRTRMPAGPARIRSGATASASKLTRSGATRPRRALPSSSTPSSRISSRPAREERWATSTITPAMRRSA